MSESLIQFSCNWYQVACLAFGRYTYKYTISFKDVFVAFLFDQFPLLVLHFLPFLISVCLIKYRRVGCEKNTVFTVSTCQYYAFQKMVSKYRSLHAQLCVCLLLPSSSDHCCKLNIFYKKHEGNLLYMAVWICWQATPQASCAT